MTEQQLHKNQFDFYLKDDDWSGRIVEDNYETVHYQKNSTVRIWFNEQTHNFDAHWHNALEIIMPVENYYDVEACGQHYRIQPDEILFIPAGEMHTLYAPAAGSRFIFQFDISVISRISEYNALQSLITTCLYITKFSHPHIYNTVRQLLLQMRDEYFGFSDFRELSIYSYL